MVSILFYFYFLFFSYKMTVNPFIAMIAPENDQ